MKMKEYTVVGTCDGDTSYPQFYHVKVRDVLEAADLVTNHEYAADVIAVFEGHVTPAFPEDPIFIEDDEDDK